MASKQNPANKRALTHERIVEVASRAIRRAGYDGVGVAGIMKEAGLTHGGFYAHFESRGALLAEAVTRAGRDSAAAVAERMQTRQARGQSGLRAIVEIYLSDAHLSGIEQGCPVAALSSEMPRQTPELLAASTVRVRSLIDRVKQVLPPARQAQAPVIVSTMVGALQLARVFGANAEGRALLTATRETLLAQYDPPA